MNKNSSSSKFPWLSVQTLVLAAVGWGIISLLFFLLFSVPLPGEGRPEWYNISTYVLENVAFLGATLLCFRNWRSSQIVSGRTVWLLLGLGMLSYFIGNCILAYWELGLGKEPDVSPADLFFLLTYLFMGIGMLMAVLSRRLNLSILQWAIVGGIGLAGVAIAYFTVIGVPEEASNPVPASNLEYAQVSEVRIASSRPIPQLFAQEEAPPAAETPADPAPVEEAPAPAPVDETPAPTPEPTDPPAAETPAPVAPEEVPAEVDTAPGWAIALEEQLAPFGDIVLWLYIIGDILLLIMATTLLLAFWGGRFSLSWRFIAASAFFFYIADIWFNYATSYIENYQTGALPEVCWIFSGLLVSIGAALEYDLSTTRSRRGSRRRGA